MNGEGSVRSPMGGGSVRSLMEGGLYAHDGERADRGELTGQSFHR